MKDLFHFIKYAKEWNKQIEELRGLLIKKEDLNKLRLKKLRKIFYKLVTPVRFLIESYQKIKDYNRLAGDYQRVIMHFTDGNLTKTDYSIDLVIDGINRYKNYKFSLDKTLGHTLQSKQFILLNIDEFKRKIVVFDKWDGKIKKINSRYAKKSFYFMYNKSRIYIKNFKAVSGEF